MKKIGMGLRISICGSFGCGWFVVALMALYKIAAASGWGAVGYFVIAVGCIAYGIWSCYEIGDYIAKRIGRRNRNA